MFTVHVDLGHHEFRDFDVKDAPSRSREERAASLCRMIGGLSWEVRQTITYEVVRVWVGDNWAVRRHSDVAEWNAETELWIYDRIVAVYVSDSSARAVAFRLNMFAVWEVEA